MIRAVDPDLVLLQEASRPASVERIATAAGMGEWQSRAGASLGFLSRTPVSFHAWLKPRLSRHAFLEVVPAGDRCRIFGVHLAAVHAAWTERRRILELRALLRSVSRHQHGLHLLAGDFNTLAPGERLDFGLLPARLRALVWLSGGRIRWRTIRQLLDSGYTDAFRTLHPDDPGCTFPTWSPHVRLDFCFVPGPFSARVESCVVVDTEDARAASDHLPLLVEVDDGPDVEPADQAGGPHQAEVAERS